jgi:hypothetical protein
MSYQKFTVDNTVCSRRFHITFDDEGAPVGKVEVKCPHCDVVVWASEGHPAVKLAREENLVKTTQLSRNLTKDCAFKDRFNEQLKSKK